MMNAKLTRIHLGLGIDEAGIQFEIEDGAGGTVTQRAFIKLPDDATAGVWLAAQTTLAAQLAELPTDMPPGNVTNALMKARNARQEAEVAHADRIQAEKDRNEAAAEAERMRAAIAIEHAQYETEASERANKLRALEKELSDAEQQALVRKLALDEEHKQQLAAIAEARQTLASLAQLRAATPTAPEPTTEK